MICVSYSYGENYEELAKIAVPPLMRYCKKHNYHWDINRVKPNEKGTYAFIRPAHARKLLDIYETVLMLEGDFLVTSMNYKIENWLEENKDYYVCKDINGVNTGSYICQSTQWMKDTLDHVLTFKDEYWDEQKFWETFTHEKIKYLSHPSINSLPYDLYAPTYGKVYGDTTNVQKPTHEEGCWHEGDFLLHLPGMELSQRLIIFNEYKNKLHL